MFNSPYSTTVTSGHQINKIQLQLEQALVEGRLFHPVVKDVPSLYAVYGKDPMVSQIEAFTHPITIDRQGKEITVVDLRAYGTQVSVAELGLQVAKVGPAALHVKQALLQIIWRQSPDSFLPLIDLPLAVYANWVSGAIARQLNLDPMTNIDVRILSGWFFLCQFLDKAEFERTATEDQKISKATKLARTLRVPIENVMQSIERVGFIENLFAFAEALKGLASTRLDRMNVLMLQQMLGGGWFGAANVREMVGVAIEFPPQFFGMVHSAATEAFYKKAIIAEVVLKQQYKDNFRRFDIGMQQLLDQAKE